MHRQLEAQSERDSDVAIRLTDSDAALARLSAVQKHYLHDPFLKFLVHRAHLQPPRPPLINVGTFLRSDAMDKLVHQWLELSAREGKRCQIVSLGAGSDTRFWRIATGGHKQQLASYIEVDFPEVTAKKAMSIRRSKELSKVLGNADEVVLSHGGTALHSPSYHLLPVDMRLPPSETLSPLSGTSLTTKLETHGQTEVLLSPTLPTLLLFECVLAYMSPEASSAIIQWFVDYFSPRKGHEVVGPLGGIVYEMFGLHDSFGRVMISNLQSRGVSVPGVKPYPDLKSLPSRFLNHGFTTSHALTLREIRRTYIEEAELGRISNLEMLDEIEELELVLEHYAITWGVKVPYNLPLESPWEDWGFKEKSQNTGVSED